MTTHARKETPAPPNFLIAHLPTSDIDRIILGAPVLFEGHLVATPEVTALRRSALVRKLIHLPSLLVAAACGLVVMDLSASGIDPFRAWPFQATVAVIFGWVAGIAYLATFRTGKQKAFQRCASVPISAMAPELPALAAGADDGAALLSRALSGPGIIEGDRLNYAAAQKRLRALVATLR